MFPNEYDNYPAMYDIIVTPLLAVTTLWNTVETGDIYERMNVPVFSARLPTLCPHPLHVVPF